MSRSNFRSVLAATAVRARAARAAVALLSGALVACSVPEEESAVSAPRPQARQILRARYFHADGDFSLGTAFPAALDGRDETLVLTAHHVFSASPVLSRSATASELSGFLRAAAFRDAFDPELGGVRAAAVLALPAAPFHESSRAGDVAAFVARAEDGVEPFRLAEAEPSIGDRVWLAARVPVESLRRVRAHPARVAEYSADLVWYRFESPDFVADGADGAAVLDSEGRVVAIHVAGDAEAAGFLGGGVPVARWLPALREALASPHPLALPAEAAPTTEAMTPAATPEADRADEVDRVD